MEIVSKVKRITALVLTAGILSGLGPFWGPKTNAEGDEPIVGGVAGEIANGFDNNLWIYITATYDPTGELRDVQIVKDPTNSVVLAPPKYNTKNEKWQVQLHVSTGGDPTQRYKVALLTENPYDDISTDYKSELQYINLSDLRRSLNEKGTLEDLYDEVRFIDNLNDTTRTLYIRRPKADGLEAMIWPPPPERPNARFAGWYTDPETGTEERPETLATLIIEHARATGEEVKLLGLKELGITTLYAHWIPSDTNTTNNKSEPRSEPPYEHDPPAQTGNDEEEKHAPETDGETKMIQPNDDRGLTATATDDNEQNQENQSTENPKKDRTENETATEQNPANIERAVKDVVGSAPSIENNTQPNWGCSNWPWMLAATILAAGCVAWWFFIIIKRRKDEDENEARS